MPDTRPNPDMSTVLRLRRAIGAIGLTLPFVLLANVYLFNVPMQRSISAFFFTELREVFVSASAGVGLFLVAYEGYSRRPNEVLTDRMVSSISGVAVFTTAFIPTLCYRENCYQPLALFDRLIPPSMDQLQQNVHFSAAGIFLIFMGITSIRLFTRCSVENLGRHKKRRNQCYRFFGWTIIAMVILIGVVKIFLPEQGRIWDAAWSFTFWAESVALWSLGLSWLLKGGTMAEQIPFLFDAEAASPGT
ncbi:hypothetical protein SAMN05444851_0008 [Aliiroseovarius sediminilitoris]|uniref:Frag1/DRAM/Sfk1 family protein n=1 Tax=Aliiroseovarius sediminilitoris TaxID=1173584 RepID=A0A1I0MGF2_9RHOB|nr:hypothetical protein [Aliiroseovarius sediminilitoris]SEV87359.1 hypothetical protein SAMN05444851_0008 [Aliiroseovarius sediminilitoris]